MQAGAVPAVDLIGLRGRQGARFVALVRHAFEPAMRHLRGQLQQPVQRRNAGQVAALNGQARPNLAGWPVLELVPAQRPELFFNTRNAAVSASTRRSRCRSRCSIPCCLGRALNSLLAARADSADGGSELAQKASRLGHELVLEQRPSRATRHAAQHRAGHGFRTRPASARLRSTDEPGGFAESLLGRLASTPRLCGALGQALRVPTDMFNSVATWARVCEPRRPALLRARSMNACECLGLCGRFCRAAASYPLRHDGDNKSDSGAAVADCALPVGQRLPAQNRRPRCWQRSRAGFRAVAPRRSRRQGVVSRHQACALAKRASRQAMASRMPRSRATSMKARLSGEPCDSIVWSMSSAMRSAVGMPWIS
jgi:hypothetical protein